MTLRLSSEVAERNTRLHAISFSRTTLSWRAESNSGLTRFSLGISGSLSSCRRLLMDCCSCARVIWLPHSVSMFVLLLLLLHDHLRIHSIGSLRKVAFVEPLANDVS